MVLHIVANSRRSHTFPRMDLEKTFIAYGLTEVYKAHIDTDTLDAFTPKPLTPSYSAA